MAISILKSSFIIFMIEPFENNVSYSYFITFYCINQSPRIRKIIFPKVCYAIFLDVFSRPKIFWNFYPTGWICFKIIDCSVNKFVELLVFKFALFKGFPFLLNFWINEATDISLFIVQLSPL